MTLCIFTGPTLSIAEGKRWLDAVFLPPAAQGDVYRAALTRPTAIGIIDGYFERVPSVSHKEILWAMTQGVHVLGAASMGALRAAELSLFGMKGVGIIYEDFASDALKGDDEVAVVHALPEDEYRPLSEALVNIRATLRAAERSGHLPATTRERMEELSQALFYSDRCYPNLLRRAQEEGLPPEHIETLRFFLREGRVDQKRLDAIAMLKLMAVTFEGKVAKKQVTYHFETTDAWQHIRERADRNALRPTQTDKETDQ